MKKYNMLDLFKFILAFFVIGIHTLEESNQWLNILFDIAVPFYFISSSYLLFNKIKDMKKEDKLTNIKKYILRMLYLYIIWLIIYSPITIYMYIKDDLYGINLVIDIIKKLFLTGMIGTCYQLWYILYTIYSSIIIYIFIKKDININYLLIMSILLVIIGYFVNIDLIKYIISQLGCGLLYMSLGNVFNKIKYNNTLVLFVLLIITYLLSIFASAYIKYLNPILLFMLVINIKVKDNEVYKVLRKSSTLIYFIHLIILFMYDLINRYINIPINSFNIVSVISLVCSLLIISLSNKITFIKKIY